MRTWLVVGIALVGIAGCGGAEKSQSTANGPLQMQFEGVSVRQYKGGTLRFEFKASTVELFEETQEIQASGGVTATIEPKLWNEKQP